MAKQTPPSLSSLCRAATPSALSSDPVSSFQTPYHRPTVRVVGSSLFAPFAGPTEKERERECEQGDAAFTFSLDGESERSQRSRVQLNPDAFKLGRLVCIGKTGTP